MTKLLFSFFALTVLAACATEAPQPDSEYKVDTTAPVFSFVTMAQDSHFVELREWAQRNHLDVASEAHWKFQLLVVGCSGDPECFFVHESAGKTSIFEPRLKKDWSATLHDATLAEKIRQMTCESAAGTSAQQDVNGECRVWVLERTREDLRASPEIARLMTELERSPAEINIIKKRKNRAR